MSKDWYERNKDEYNAARRRRYGFDPSYRKKQVRRSKAYRKAQPKAKTRDWVLRMKNGGLIKVFRIGAVANRIGTSVSSIRRWDKLELLPECTIPGGHRFFEEHQIKWLAILAKRRAWHKTAESKKFLRDMRRAW